MLRCCSLAAETASPALALNWRRGEAAKFALDKTGKSDRRAVLEITANDLYAYRQTALGAADRHRRRRQPVQRSKARPHALIVVRHLGAVDIELAGGLRRGVVVREGYARHRRTEHDIDIVEQRQPAGTQPTTDAALADPFRMADGQPAYAESREALIVGGEGIGGGLDPLARLRRQIGAEKRRQQLAINPARLGEIR